MPTAYRVFMIGTFQGAVGGFPESVQVVTVFLNFKEFANWRCLESSSFGEFVDYLPAEGGRKYIKINALGSFLLDKYKSKKLVQINQGWDAYKKTRRLLRLHLIWFVFWPVVLKCIHLSKPGCFVMQENFSQTNPGMP
ncbi:unnamed protein product [Enterobius vermicularis]|uniref:PLAT domain-containing protein n=1 Tax=Enterobius vermicularis TaxID=51028 RepID=A0A0N4V5Z8_ENTVE|nr:unnamed protein product [Enterobius vermicularis]